MANGNIWITIEGIKGTFAREGEAKDAIEVESFSWGIHNAQGASAGSGETQAGKAHFGELNITKAFDVNSSKIMQAVASCQAIPKVVLGYMKQINSTNQTYIFFTLENAFFVSQQVHGSGENPGESLSIAYSKLKIEYKPQKPDGKSLDGAVGAGWDIRKNVKV